MAISFLKDTNGKYVIRVREVRPHEEVEYEPESAPSILRDEDPEVIVINNSGGSQALIFKVESRKGTFSFAHLTLGEGKIGDDAVVAKATKAMVDTIHGSLAAGGGRAEPLNLKWKLKNDLSLNDVANAVSTKLRSPVTLEVPGLVKVRGKL